MITSWTGWADRLAPLARRLDERMSQGAAMNRFLAGVEKKAFFMARTAVGNTDDALDIVQETMLTLASRYGRKSEAEWRPLFYRILKNRITDWHRRNATRRRFLAPAPVAPEDTAPDPIDAVAGPASVEPDTRMALDGAARELSTLVAALPSRQQEAFLLRALEGLDVAETARVMRCSQGSVKTHYSRAVHSLRHALGEHWS